MSQSTDLPFIIVPARSSAAYAAAADLFQAYAASLKISLIFQNFAAELASIPGSYSPPGELLLAYRASMLPTSSDQSATALDSMPIGCIALRPLPSVPGRCEIKRLYTTPNTRGLGLGKALVKEIMKVAIERRYKEIVLDTLDSMSAARRIYEKEGFRKTEAYYDTPIEGTYFLRFDLEQSRPTHSMPEESASSVVRHLTCLETKGSGA